MVITRDVVAIPPITDKMMDNEIGYVKVEAFTKGKAQEVASKIKSLEKSGELFWVANNPAAPPSIDYLAFHQAQVAVLSMRIGADIGYDRQRLVPLGMAGCLLDVGLWQLSESVLRRLDALTSTEEAQYRSHPKLSAEIVRRWGPPDEGIVAAVLQHHEREQEQGFPQGLSGAAIHPDAKILGLVDTYTALTVPPADRQATSNDSRCPTSSR